MGKERPQSALIVGAGSIGRRHLGNLKQLGLSKLSACDPHPDRLAYVREHFQAESFANIEDGLKSKPDIVLICSPPVQHADQALQAVRAGAHVFIEKPLSDSMDSWRICLLRTRRARPWCRSDITCAFIRRFRN